MKKLLFVGLLASLLGLAAACVPDPVTPNWQSGFEAFADTSISYPGGSSLLRCYWMDEWVYLVENPLSSCVACQVLTVQGDTIFLDNVDEQLDYIENRRRCEEVWRKE